MANSTFFSFGMPFSMRPDETNRPDRYHRGHLDTDWQKDLILPFQINAQYAHLVELGDPFRFQVKSTPIISNHLYLADCDGVIVAEFTATATAAVTGDVTSDGTQYTTYHYAYANLLTLISGGPVPEGRYYLKYVVAYADASTYVAVSEPIDVKAYHSETILIEYSHSTYKYGIPFSTIPARFRKRIRGYVESFIPKSISTVYQDQNSDTQTLDFAPYRAWRLYIGHSQRRYTEGVADWELDKLNRILGCDGVLIDGKAFQFSAANPSWNIQTPTSNPLKVADIEIQEAVDSEDATSPPQSVFLYGTGTYPYAIGHIKIGTFTVAGARRVANSTDETSALATWNSGLAANELTGSIAKVGSNIVYNNGPGERYTLADVTKFTQKFSFLHTPAGVNTLTMTLGNATGVISWGDGVAEEAYVTTSTAFNHSYAGAGFYTVEIYGALETFIMNEANTSTLTGPFPGNLTTLSLQLMTFPSNTFDFALLSNTLSTLTTLLMSNNGLVAISNMTSYQFQRLSNIQFPNNSLTQTEMNDFIADVAGNAYFNAVNNGLLNVGAQVPPVTLNSTGSSSKAALQAIGWSVFN